MPGWKPCVQIFNERVDELFVWMILVAGALICCAAGPRWSICEHVRIMGAEVGRCPISSEKDLKTFKGTLTWMTESTQISFFK